jgi:hypothetical protein
MMAVVCMADAQTSLHVIMMKQPMWKMDRVSIQVAPMQKRAITTQLPDATMALALPPVVPMLTHVITM